jgi:hypothetical protein
MYLIPQMLQDKECETSICFLLLNKANLFNYIYYYNNNNHNYNIDNNDDNN